MSGLLYGEGVRRGTRARSRALNCFKQAGLVLRSFLDRIRAAQSARENAIGKSTTYDYLHEGLTVLAARAPRQKSALLAEKLAGHSHLGVEGTLIESTGGRRSTQEISGGYDWVGF